MSFNLLLSAFLVINPYEFSSSLKVDAPPFLNRNKLSLVSYFPRFKNKVLTTAKNRFYFEILPLQN